MAALWIEFILLFVVAPALFAFTRHRIPAIPMLWIVSGYCLFVMAHNRTRSVTGNSFSDVRLWDASGLAGEAPAILGLFAVIAVMGIVLVRRYAPQSFLSFPRSKPRMWATLMVLYPVLSVYPQGIVYRAFLFERYRSLFNADWAIVLVSAAAFAWVHIVFRNALAVGLCFPAGLLFAARYLWTGSLVISSFEHALYGCTIFTIGLGEWFYHGAVRERVALRAASGAGAS